MLEVLVSEFGDMIPLESNQALLDANAASSLSQLRENSLIETLLGSAQTDPLLWQFTMTSKGTQRAKNLAKSVGLVIKLEVDLEEAPKLEDSASFFDSKLAAKSVNKVTINMYDKELMPVVDDLYLNDQSMVLLSMKQEGVQEELNNIFDPFIEQIENSLCNRPAALEQVVKAETSYAFVPFQNEDEEEELIQDDEDDCVPSQMPVQMR